MRTRLVALAIAAVAATSLCGCQSLLFRQDHAVTLTSPAQFATVSLPLRVTWTTASFRAPDDGEYAVFVDRDPMPPGAGIDYFQPNNRFDIYVQSQPYLVLQNLAPVLSGDPGEANHHDITVVLLDRDGHRVGETAAFTEFTVQT